MVIFFLQRDSWQIYRNTKLYHSNYFDLSCFYGLHASLFYLCQLDTGLSHLEREAQLRKCLQQIGLWATL